MDLGWASPSGGGVTMSTWWEERTDRIVKAACLVSAQADCTVDEAFGLLRTHANATGHDLNEIAVAAREHRIRFSPRRAGTRSNPS